MRLPIRVHVCLWAARSIIILLLALVIQGRSAETNECPKPLPEPVLCPTSTNNVFHGAAIFKNPFGPDGSGRAHVGDTITANVRVRNLDDFNDSLTITNMVGVIHHGTGSVVTPNLLSTPVTLTNFGDFVDANYFYQVLPADGELLLDDAQSGGIDQHDGCFATCLAQDFFVTFPGQIRILRPCIQVFKSCANGVGENGVITWSGLVTNCGNTLLTNVVVSNLVNGVVTRVFGPTNLSAGQFATFTGSYTNHCEPTTDTLFAYGTDELRLIVTNAASATCSNVITARMVVTKSCPANAVNPGSLLTFSGTISNSGDVTLTNVLVFNNRPTNNTPVVGPMTLMPGSNFAFTGSYTTPADTCGPWVDTLTATARSICGVTLTTNSNTAICPYTNTPAILVTKICQNTLVQPGATLTYTGVVQNVGNITLTNIIVVNTTLTPPSTNIVFTLGNLAPGGSVTFVNNYVVPADSCGPYTDTLTASGQDKCFGVSVTNISTRNCLSTNTPVIRVTKFCENVLVQPGGTLTYTGLVENLGNITLTNIVVVNTQLGTNTIVFTRVNLAPGASATFVGSYVVPPDSCGPYTDTLTASGQDKCFGVSVTNASTRNCPGTNSPAILVTKFCQNTLVQPGGVLTYTGLVQNVGNITLTNIVVVNTQLGTNTIVFTRVNLAPGASVTFTGSYIVPPDSCGPYLDTLTASGQDKCFGVGVTNTSTRSCAGTNSPAILVTKFCEDVLVQPGATLTYTGLVQNVGNITLTNIIVVNTQFGTNTIVFTGANLAPGDSVTFTGSYVVPPDSCGPYLDTLTASGQDKCFGVGVTNTSTRSCASTNSPAILVTKFCQNALVQPGGTLTYTGLVQNVGNITLTNIIVVNTQLGTNTVVFTRTNLAPGGSATFVGSYVVPLDSCGPYRDTLTASGQDKCFGVAVTNSSTRDCLSTNTPAIVVTKFCPPTPTGPGQVLVFSGIVSNAGNITLTNVVVVNNQPFNNAPVLGPISLAPGQAVAFSGNYRTPPDSCGPYIDTLTASGRDKCFGVGVTNTSTRSCPGITTPRIFIQKFCPMNPDGTVQPTPFGGNLCYSGIVSNSGDITLTNVFVYNNKPEPNTLVLGPAILAPGQFIRFTNCYIVAGDDCCGPYPDTLTAVGTDKCTGSNVVKTSTAVCPGITFPSLSITRTCPTNPVVIGQPIPFQGIISNSGNVVLSNVIVIDNNGVVIMSMGGFANAEYMDYSGTFIISNCPPSGIVTNTITIRGNDICNGAVVSASATCIIACSTNANLPVTIISPSLMGTKFGLSFQSQQGKSYTVQYIDSLALPMTNWQTISNLTGNGSILQINDHNATNSERFYRVLLNP